MGQSGGLQDRGRHLPSRQQPLALATVVRQGHGAHHCGLQVIIGHLPTGKVIIEEEMKEEMKEDVDPHNGADDGKCGACPPTLGPRGMDPSLAN